MIDERTSALDYRPGGLIHWEVNTGLATKMPSAFKHHLKDKAIARVVASSIPKSTEGKNIFPVLYDSGCGRTQIPSYMTSLLDDVHTIPPVSFDTAGHAPVTCKEMGTLRFTVQGVPEIISMPCLLNPGTHLMLLSLDQFEALDKGKIRSKLWKNTVKYKGTYVPVVRKYGAPFLHINVLSGTHTIDPSS